MLTQSNSNKPAKEETVEYKDSDAEDRGEEDCINAGDPSLKRRSWPRGLVHSVKPMGRSRNKGGPARYNSGRSRGSGGDRIKVRWWGGVVFCSVDNDSFSCMCLVV